MSPLISKRKGINTTTTQATTMAQSHLHPQATGTDSNPHADIAITG
jgi:hypothetical protein